MHHPPPRRLCPSFSFLLLSAVSTVFVLSQPAPLPAQDEPAAPESEAIQAPEPDRLEADPEAKPRKSRRARRAEKEARDAAIAALDEVYRNWLRDVQWIISPEEIDLFLELGKDYQRDAFIERFWKVRDEISRTGRNEFKERYLAQLELAAAFNYDRRAEILMLNGVPAERFEINCTPTYHPMEVWFYAGTERAANEYILLFYQRSQTAPFELWEPLMGFDELIANRQSVTGTGIDAACRRAEDADILRAALGRINSYGAMGAAVVIAELTEPPDYPEKEWVATFSSYSTDLPEGAETFAAEVHLDFPGRHQSRTVLQGVVEVPRGEVKLGELGSARTYNLMLAGEILLDGKLFENFRYKFDYPAEPATPAFPLVFQRYLRPGSYQLNVLVEDLNSGRYFRHVEPLEVPHVEAARSPEPDDPETARLLAEANAAISTGENTLKIIPLTNNWLTGLARVDTLTTGPNVAQVRFLVDGETVVTKRTPPFNVELDFGRTPRAMTLRAEALDADGNEVANDEVLLNAGQHRFAVRLSEPRPGKTYRESLRAQAEVLIPEGELVDRVEFFLNEEPVATVYHPPYIQPILLPEVGALAYVRAVAFTPDGTSTEDVVFINAPDYLENVDIDFVELYTAVLDKQRRPVDGLTEADFAVFEDGVAQEVVRFDRVRDLSIHAAVMLDVSASMLEELDGTRVAALHFFEQAIQPRDRAALITFNDHPNLATPFTNDVEDLARGLAGLKAERGTSLYDSLVFALYYFNGIKGQRAILLLSDGKDESSRYRYEDALEYARRAGVAIYSIGLKLEGKGIGDAKRKLTQIAEETGGRSFFVDDESQLREIYETIQLELRSRYLLAYQSTNTSDSTAFRTIDVEVAQAGLEAKTLRGYYP